MIAIFLLINILQPLHGHVVFIKSYLIHHNVRFSAETGLSHEKPLALQMWPWFWTPAPAGESRS